jgi:TonB-dependent starch-binding outer membrane protein SusC
MQNLLKVWCTCLCVLAAFAALAQPKNVTGTVTDAGGVKLAGVTVTVKNTKISTTSDGEGRFKVLVPETANTLVLTYVGMESQEVKIGSQTAIAVSLKPAAADALNDVVVIGYGTARRTNVTSSISSVSSKELRNLPVAGADQALQGKVAGVMVTNNGGQPGGGVSVRIRGITSVNGNEPLYVVDGVPILTSTNSGAFNALGGGGGQNVNSVLATINPNDIESMDVLKDASAQAIYGSLAANGVVIINTKKGKSGEGKLNYNGYYGLTQVPKLLPMMNLREFAAYHNKVAPLAGQTPAPEFQDPSVLGEGTNWQREIFQVGAIQNHQLSFSGGQNKTTYFFSANYFDQEGILIGSKFKRYALRMSIDQQVKSWLRAGISANATRSNQSLTLADEQDGTITQALLQSPAIPVRNFDGSWGGPGTNIGGIIFFQDNPVAKADIRTLTAQQSKLFGSIYVDLQLAKGLSFRNELGYDFQLNSNTSHQRRATIGITPYQSQLIENRNNSMFWVFRNYLNYNTSIGVHHINATAGHEAQTSNYDFIGASRLNLATDDLPALNVGEQLNQTLQGGKGHFGMESYFARAGYSYSDRYSVNLSFRADASSNFGPSNKWGYFPAASVGWIVSNEKFLQNNKTFNYLKLRVGAGSVGNQNPPNGAPAPPYAAVVRFNTNGFGAGNFLRNIGNPDLKWESVVTYNAGVDLSLLNKRVDVTVDVYKKVTKDMLLFSSAPRFTGVGPEFSDVLAPVVNAGQMTNTGIDLAIASRNIVKRDFSWTSNFIFSHFRNNLDNLISEGNTITGRVVFGTILVTNTTAGQPVGSFFGLRTDGIFRNQAEVDASLPQFGLPTENPNNPNQRGTGIGDLRFVDVNGDKIIDANDATFIGNPNPKFTYGFTNTFTYKGFELTLFLQGVYGNKILNFQRVSTEGLRNVFNNQLRSVSTEMFSADNVNGSMPRFTTYNNNNTAVSDRFIEDGSYLRVQNLTLGYNLPGNWLNRAKIASARLYISCQNLLTFSKYSGYDPEIGSFNKSVILTNVDNGHYPNPRMYTFGVNLDF